MSDIRVQHSNRSSRIGTAIVVIAFVALAAAPWWAERADLRLLAEIYAYVALASLWNLLAGYAGLVSVGQQAYVGLGGCSVCVDHSRRSPSAPCRAGSGGSCRRARAAGRRLDVSTARPLLRHRY